MRRRMRVCVISEEGKGREGIMLIWHRGETEVGRCGEASSEG